MRRRVLVATVLCGVVAFGAVQASATTTITVKPICSRWHGCSFDPTDYSAGVGETSILSLPSNADTFHNVTALKDGPDGRPLFRSPLTGPGGTNVVDGTQYLKPGVYPFICTIHSHPTVFGDRMTGTLVVTDNGATPLARPTVDVTFPSQSLGQVRKRNEITVTVESEAPAGDVVLVAKQGPRRLGWVSGLSLEAGAPSTVEVPLKDVGRRALKGLKSAVVSVQGSVRFGIPDTARRRLG
jgi:plastocyanin